MKKNFLKRSVVCIGLCGAFVVGAFAGGTVISATLRPDIKVVIDGTSQSFSDANGTTVYPISYNNTTYLPIRAIGGIMEKAVGWDEATQTITLSDGHNIGGDAANKELVFSGGNYVAGKDFPSGTYTVKAIKGSGNVYTSNMFSGGMNEIMAATTDGSYVEGLYTSEFKNCKMPAGTELGIKGTVVVQLTAE